MAGRFGTDDEPISDINITPFVDVVLVLLVIFMVTAGIMVHRGMRVELPEAATAEELGSQINLEVAIARNGALLLNGSDADLAKIRLVGQESLARNGKVVVMIAADRGVAYDAVVSVMDAFRSVGITEFALELERPR